MSDAPTKAQRKEWARLQRQQDVTAFGCTSLLSVTPGNVTHCRLTAVHHVGTQLQTCDTHFWLEFTRVLATLQEFSDATGTPMVLSGACQCGNHGEG